MGLSVNDRQPLIALVTGLPVAVFTARDSVGWCYQFWQAEKKDAVNAAGNKIGADELPAVTQLFTEDYMVDFLLDNTLGTWWAGKVLAAQPTLASTAQSEDELRKAVALPGCPWNYLRFIRTDTPSPLAGDGPHNTPSPLAGEGRGEGGNWTPAAGTFPGWPKTAKELKCLDPCMGSGHFEVAMFERLVALRLAEEQLDQAAAVAAVIRDNLFGLEIDPRCTQIAAFNLALAAWRQVGYCPLPAMNLACSGLAPNSREADWLAIAGGDDMLQRGMERLYRLFQNAPVLGSLINPRAVEGDLLEACFHELQPLLEQALARETTDDTAHEMAVTAHGLAKAAEILAGQFTLVTTNVPYLSSQKQAPLLWDYVSQNFPFSKADLAAVFIERAGLFTECGGTIALVTPLAWTFLGSYRKLRLSLLETRSIAVLARLGAGAFETISGEVVSCALSVISNHVPTANHALFAIDASGGAAASSKAQSLRQFGHLMNQRGLRENPDSRFVVEELGAGVSLLSEFADAYYGQGTGDLARFGGSCWEVPALTRDWERVQSTVEESMPFGGRCLIVFWEQGRGGL